MDDKNENKLEKMLGMYKERMLEYCNRYDNIIILNQLKPIVGEINLSDVYADFSLIERVKYEKKNGKNDIEQDNYCSEKSELISENIKAYKSSVDIIIKENEDHREKNALKKVYLYINVVNITGFRRNVYKVKWRIKDCFDAEESLQDVIIKGYIESLDLNKNNWIWVRGYEVSESENTYYLLEPYWFKRDKQLTEEDQDFLKSDVIIEENITQTQTETHSNSDDQNSTYDEAVDSSIKGMVLLSEPGGGKTTYLKHLIYQLMSRAQTLDEDFWSINGLEKNSCYFPIFIRTRDHDALLKNTVNDMGDLFNRLVKRGILNILSVNTEDSVSKDSELISEIMFSDIFLNERNAIDYKKLIIIDGFEELDDNKAQNLLTCLENAYSNGVIDRKKDRLIISSRYKEYGYQRLVEYCAKHNIDEKFLVFDNQKSAIDNWFDILEKTNKTNRAYFNKMRTHKDIAKLITTPLELTGLIMLCYTQSVLPTDITVLYRSIIEIWLTYGVLDAKIPVFSLSDIFLELSAIAYCMADSDDRQRISRDELVKIIETCREDLRRYYRSSSYVEASSPEEIKDLLDFWIKRNIFVKNSSEEVYEFVHREYQSFLISYAIVCNFIPKKNRKMPAVGDDSGLKRNRKEARLVYLQSHMEHAEDFWDRVIIFSAFMSTDLHDAIIAHIFAFLKDYDSKKDQLETKDVDKYYLSVILQLANSDGFYLDDREYETLFGELLKDMDRISFMNNPVKRDEIKSILANCRESIREMVLRNCIEKMKACNENIKKYVESQNRKDLEKSIAEKHTLLRNLSSIVFRIVWSDDLKKETLEEAVELYLYHWINTTIIDDIKASLEKKFYRKDRIELFEKIAKDARETKHTTDCYMIIAIIYAYLQEDGDEKRSPYEVAREFFKTAKEDDKEDVKDVDALIKAINIVDIAVWLVKVGYAKECDCEIKDKNGYTPLFDQFKKCVENICKYMRNVTEECIYKHDLLATYRSLCLIQDEDLNKYIETNYKCEEIFSNCLELCKEELMRNGEETQLRDVYQIIASYPLTESYVFSDETKEILGQKREEIIQYKKTYELSSEERVYIFKLLILAGYYEGKYEEIYNEIYIIRSLNKWSPANLIVNRMLSEIESHFGKDWFEEMVIKGK